MNNSFKIFLSLITMIVISLSSLSPILAQESTPVRDRISNRCTLVTERVNLITTRYEQNRQRHIERYQNIYKRVSDLVSKLESKGYDVSKLKTDLVQLNTMTQTFAQEYNSVMVELNNSKNHACGNSEGDFRQAITNAKNNLVKARETALEIRVLVNDQIKPELHRILSQIKNN